VNYAELQSAIVAETENTDTSFAASIPTFVRNAEKRIYQAVKLPSMRKNAVSAIGASSSSYALFLQIFLLRGSLQSLTAMGTISTFF
jgi:hypothetical protein